MILINRRLAREIKPEPVLEIPMAISRLQIFFPAESITFVFAGFIVDKLKRQTTFGGINFAGLVWFKAFAQIVRAADVMLIVGFR